MTVPPEKHQQREKPRQKWPGAPDPVAALPFEKWSGAGNDFVLLAADDLPPTSDHAQLARVLCRRGFGVGADGLIVIAGRRAEYWNVDGSPAAFCGNGARCVGRYLLERAASGTEQVTFTLGAVPTHAWLAGPDVAVAVPAPRVLDREAIRAQGALRGDLETAFGRRILDGAWIDAGVPQLVLHLDGRPPGALEAVAESLQTRAPFAPAGTNLTCLWSRAGALAELRTWERGVRAETLACGSAALAAAYLLWEHRGGGEIALLTKGGATLVVERRAEGWVLRGPAGRICRGTASIPAA